MGADELEFGLCVDCISRLEEKDMRRREFYSMKPASEEEQEEDKED
jgi:hypothetical protein